MGVFGFAYPVYFAYFACFPHSDWGSGKECVSSHVCMNMATFRARFVARLSESHFFGTSCIIRGIYGFCCIVEAWDGNVYPATCAWMWQHLGQDLCLVPQLGFICKYSTQNPCILWWIFFSKIKITQIQNNPQKLGLATSTWLCYISLFLGGWNI